MANRKPLIDKDGEVREITAEDVALFKPFSTLPKAEQEMLLSARRRGPQKAPRKVPISIRLSPDVAEGLRATGRDGSGAQTKCCGPGWQTRPGRKRSLGGTAYNGLAANLGLPGNSVAVDEIPGQP